MRQCDIGVRRPARRWVGWVVGLVAMPAVLGGGPAAGGYGITDLNTLGGSFSAATAINNRGQVVGQSTIDDAGTRRAFLYADGVMTDLGGLGGATSLAAAINDDGLVVGYATTAGSTLHRATIFTGGAVIDLNPLLGAVDSEARGVGHDGQVVGIGDIFDKGDFVSRGFVVDGGAASWLDTLGGRDAAATATNGLGLVAGTASTADDSCFHAVLYDGATALDLGTLGGDNSAAVAVNAAGMVVGYAQPAGPAVFHAFLRVGSVMTDLGTLGGPESVANALNARGDVVGRSSFADDNYGAMHAFLYRDGAMIDLNSLLPADSGWELTAATGINDAGWIVGYGINPAGDTHAFLLRPTAVPEPGAAALLAIGLGVLGMVAHRKSL